MYNSNSITSSATREVCMIRVMVKYVIRKGGDHSDCLMWSMIVRSVILIDEMVVGGCYDGKHNDNIDE